VSGVGDAWAVLNNGRHPVAAGCGGCADARVQSSCLKALLQEQALAVPSGKASCLKALAVRGDDKAIAPVHVARAEWADA
jgi:hypothetical protein